MALVAGGSAPERADALSRLWAGLPPERLVQLGCKWVDFSVRQALPTAFEKVGHEGVGAILRTLPPIDGPAAIRFAHDQLMVMKTPNEPVEPLAAYFTLLASLKDLVEEFSIYECCFLTVMASRLAFGDDRTVDSMAADIEAVAPK